MNLLSEIAGMGIKVRVEGVDLALVAPRGVLTPKLISKVRRSKPALIESLSDIRAMAGTDWQEIADDPAQLQAFVESADIVLMRQQGRVPEHYTVTTVCRRCGTVPVFEGAPAEVLGCPWCFNRIRGLPIPNVPR